MVQQAGDGRSWHRLKDMSALVLVLADDLGNPIPVQDSSIAEEEEAVVDRCHHPNRSSRGEENNWSEADESVLDSGTIEADGRGSRAPEMMRHTNCHPEKSTRVDHHHPEKSTTVDHHHPGRNTRVDLGHHYRNSAAGSCYNC